MSAYRDLVQKGIRVRLRADGNLGLSPVDAITEDIKQYATAHKQEIIEYLQQARRDLAQRASSKTHYAQPVPTLPVMRPTASVSRAVRYTGGVGAELKKLIPGFFRLSGCGCRNYAKLLDVKGVAWCEENQEEILVQARKHAREAFARSDELTSEVLAKAIENARESLGAWQARLTLER